MLICGMPAANYVRCLGKAHNRSEEGSSSDGGESASLTRHDHRKPMEMVAHIHPWTLRSKTRGTAARHPRHYRLG
jgi:hypothetical protein